MLLIYESSLYIQDTRQASPSVPILNCKSGSCVGKQSWEDLPRQRAQCIPVVSICSGCMDWYHGLGGLIEMYFLTILEGWKFQIRVLVWSELVSAVLLASKKFPSLCVFREREKREREKECFLLSPLIKALISSWKVQPQDFTWT